MKADHIYPHLPVLAQQLACSLYGLKERRIRLGPAFRRHYSRLLQSDFASPTEIRDYQDAQVRNVVRQAYTTVPYYRKLFRRLDLTPSDIQTVSDLAILPVLKKAEVARQPREFVSVGRGPLAARWEATSGSTGTPLKFLVGRETSAIQWATWWRHRSRFGVLPLTWHANFTSHPVVPPNQQDPPYWRYNYPIKQIVVGMQHLTPALSPLIAEHLNSRGLAYFSGYPSVVAGFCEIILATGNVRHLPVKAVFLGGEPVTDIQARAIVEATGAVVTDQYGFAEAAGNASRCQEGNYHEDWEMGLLECVEGESLQDGSTRGNIVATGFWNSCFPFIRYEVGDVAVWAPGNFVCSCGRSSRVITSVEGRIEDVVVTPDGRRISRFSLLFRGLGTVSSAQVRQTESDAVVIRLVPRGRHVAPSDTQTIRDRFSQLIGDGLDLQFEVVDAIERTQRGKLRAVVSLERHRSEVAST